MVKLKNKIKKSYIKSITSNKKEEYEIDRSYYNFSSNNDKNKKKVYFGFIPAEELHSFFEILKKNLSEAKMDLYDEKNISINIKSLSNISKYETIIKFFIINKSNFFDCIDFDFSEY